MDSRKYALYTRGSASCSCSMHHPSSRNVGKLQNLGWSESKREIIRSIESDGRHTCACPTMLSPSSSTSMQQEKRSKSEHGIKCLIESQGRESCACPIHFRCFESDLAALQAGEGQSQRARPHEASVVLNKGHKLATSTITQQTELLTSISVIQHQQLSSYQV